MPEKAVLPEVTLSLDDDEVEISPLEMEDAVPVGKPVPRALVEPLPYGAEEERLMLEDAGEVPVERAPVESEMGAVPKEEVGRDATLEVLFMNGAEEVEASVELRGAVPLLTLPVETRLWLVLVERGTVEELLEDRPCVVVATGCLDDLVFYSILALIPNTFGRLSYVMLCLALMNLLIALKEFMLRDRWSMILGWQATVVG